MEARFASLEKQIAENRADMRADVEKGVSEARADMRADVERRVSEARADMREEATEIRADVEKVKSKLSEVEEVASGPTGKAVASKQEQAETQTGSQIAGMGVAKRETAPPDWLEKPLERQRSDTEQVENDLEERRAQALEAGKAREEPNQTTRQESFSHSWGSQLETQHRPGETSPEAVPKEELGHQTQPSTRAIRLLPGRRPIRDGLELLLDMEPKASDQLPYRLRTRRPSRRRALLGAMRGKDL